MTSPTSTDAVALLRELEWSHWRVSDDGHMSPCCPTCRGFKYDQISLHPKGHTPDCRLAKAIAEQPAEAAGADEEVEPEPPYDWDDGFTCPCRGTVQFTSWLRSDGAERGRFICARCGFKGKEDFPCDLSGTVNKYLTDYALRTRIEAEDRAKSGGEHRNPDHVYDKADWEWTSTWDDRNTLTDALNVGEIIHVGTLYKGPDKWAARIDDVEVRWFDTREEAEAALAPRATTDHEGEAK